MATASFAKDAFGEFPAQGIRQGIIPAEKNLERESRMNTADSQMTRESAGKEQGIPFCKHLPASPASRNGQRILIDRPPYRGTTKSREGTRTIWSTRAAIFVPSFSKSRQINEARSDLFRTAQRTLLWLGLVLRLS